MRFNSRRLGTLTRAAGAVLLGAGLVYALLHFPTRPTQDWEGIHAFGLTDSECQLLLGERLTTRLLVPAEAETPVTTAGVAENFNLELRLVCEANEWPASCGDRALTPAVDSLTLPLYYETPPALREEPR